MTQNNIEKAVDILNSGGIIAYPTDTLWGLGADITNYDAVIQIYKLKQRSFDKPLSIAASSIEMAKKYFEISPKNQIILEHFLPGPYTFILPKKSIVLDIITSALKTAGLRIPGNPNTLKLIEQFKKPIITTSINKSGEEELLDIKNLSIPVDFIFPGSCKFNSPSTIVDLINKSVIRRGVDAEKIEKYLQKIKNEKN